MTDEIPPEQTLIDVFRENDHADRTQLIAVEPVDEWSEYAGPTVHFEPGQEPW